MKLASHCDKMSMKLFVRANSARRVRVATFPLGYSSVLLLGYVVFGPRPIGVRFGSRRSDGPFWLGLWSFLR
ncbi:hypothetical protein SBA7_780007 [Candidatus Sulfotelmatobacter sp. SbA7]|nr:hypothetical protein SBA7_780007 [Candidatus Sulfotelmatobacter sp. SbA7]